MTRRPDTTKLLSALGLESENPGACWGVDNWSATTSEGRIDSRDPATGRTIATVYHCSASDYEATLASATNAFEEWRTVPAPKRGEVVRRMADALRSRKELLGELVSLEMGKIRQEGLGEVQEMIDMADFAVGLSRQLYGHTMHSERPFHRMYEQWHPLGTVGVITSFNFPVAVWSWNAFIAAVCGDAVVWKPSSSTPLCALAVQKICNDVLRETGSPPIFQLVIGSGRTIGDRLVRDRRVPLISFTGSTVMGQQIATIVAERLGRSILELGGNNAIIIDETADLALAIPAVLFGAVGTAGQRCTSTRRLFVHHTISNAVVSRLVDAYRQIPIGNPLDENTLMGPLVDRDAVGAFCRALEAAGAEGAEVLYGGKALDGEGCYVQPTLVRATSEMAIVREETFAPILYVIPFDDLCEAIRQQNDVPQGLSSSIFTRDLKNAELFLSHRGSDCGIANVNIGTSGAEIGGAFGGEKETGGGREAGSDAWKAYMRRQTNTINWGTELPLAQGIRFGTFTNQET